MDCKHYPLILPDDCLLSSHVCFSLFWKVRALQLSLFDFNLFQIGKHPLFFPFRICWNIEPLFRWLFFFFLIFLINGLKKMAFVQYVCVHLPLPFQSYTTSFKIFIWLCYFIPKLREQGLVHFKSHVVLHADLTGYFLCTKLLSCGFA